MTAPNEADAKVLAEKLLNECAAQRLNSFGLGGMIASKPITIPNIEQVCTRLLELEEQLTNFTCPVSAQDVDVLFKQDEIDALKARNLELEEENKRLYSVPVKWNEAIYNQGYKAALDEIATLKAELQAANERIRILTSPYVGKTGHGHTGPCNPGCTCDAAKELPRSPQVENE